jgi:hypothetical protein
MKVRDFTKIPLQRFAITRQPDRFAVVVHFVMNELFQLSPILPVETVDIFAVDGGKTGVGQSTCLRRAVPSGHSRRRALGIVGSSSALYYLVKLTTANLGRVATFDRRTQCPELALRDILHLRAISVA